MVEASKIKYENNIARIIEAISSENALNPPNRLKFPCSICNKNCLKNQCHLLCKRCNKRCHIKCNDTAVNEYRYFLANEDNPSIPWFCLYCTLFRHYELFPFTLCSISELMNINNSNTMEFCEVLPSLETIEETASFEKYSLPDLSLIHISEPTRPY